MITMAKGIGNGAPLGGMTTTVGISEVMKRRVHFNTFGGNPISMTQGLATLEIIDEENIQQNALEVGTHLKEALVDLQEKHELIGEVRGLGLMLGVELVRDRNTKQPAKQETLAVLEAAREMGVLVGKGGLDGNVLRIKPPMCITQDDADFTIDVLDRALAAAAS
jgi:alanine-glyoxylate transaminase/(R)-3-amino-2-methylpropionate-pyruvate transaminase